MTFASLPRQLIPVRPVHLETPDSYLRRLCLANSIDYPWMHSVIRTRRIKDSRDVRDLGVAIHELGGPSPDRFEAAHAYACLGHINLRGPWAKQAASQTGCLSCTPPDRTSTYPHIRFAFCRRHRQWLGGVQRQGVLDAELWKAERMLRQLVSSGRVDRELYETTWELIRDNAYLIGERTWPKRLQRALNQANFTRGTDDRIALYPQTVRVIRTVSHPTFVQQIIDSRRNDPRRRKFLSESLDWVGTERWLLVEGIDQFVNRKWAQASGVSRHWLTAWSATRPRATLARMSSAVAVHTNGLGSLLCAAR